MEEDSFYKLFLLGDYSSVSLAAATFPHKGRLSSSKVLSMDGNLVEEDSFYKLFLFGGYSSVTAKPCHRDHRRCVGVLGIAEDNFHLQGKASKFHSLINGRSV